MILGARDVRSTLHRPKCTPCRMASYDFCRATILFLIAS
jgi:hypothetical protein